MAGPGNQHCASCIGTLSFPIPVYTSIPRWKCLVSDASERTSVVVVVLVATAAAKVALTPTAVDLPCSFSDCRRSKKHRSHLTAGRVRLHDGIKACSQHTNWTELQLCAGMHIQGGPKKMGHRLTAILSNLNRFKKSFFTGRFPGKFVVRWILQISPHLAHVAILPCETVMSAKQAINDILQGSVATYLRCGRVVNNQSRKGLLLSMSVNFCI